MEINIQNSFNKLLNYIESENFKGYDPYDTLNSWVPFHWLGKWGPILATQFQKRNPINIRPLLGIKKDYNPKAIGLFLQAYSLLYAKTNKKEYLEKADFFYTWLSEKYSKGYSGYCWSYNFPWANPNHYYDAYTPSGVVTGFVCKGIWEYYKVTKNNKALEVLKSSVNFILNDLSKFEDETGICISYTPAQKDICYNASLLAGEIIAINYVITKKEEYKDLCKSIVNFVITRQHEDGKWMYSQDLESGRERHQIDFHQGFVLVSLHNLARITGILKEEIHNALKKGLEFYQNNQFFINGRSLRRLPKKWPVDIHNQSQGIITFTRLKEFDSSYEDFAKKIAIWTIKNMQDEIGYFYYRKTKYFMNKIPYIRWSQAWMMLALAELMINGK